MKFVAIRPESRRERAKAKVALFTVAFDPSELRRHNSSFSIFCKNWCEYGPPIVCRNHCCNDGEYGRLMELWSNQGYLIPYFKNRIHLLNTERYGNITNVNDAIYRTKELLEIVQRQILQGDLNEIFKPLYNNPSHNARNPEMKKKVKIWHKDFENWLRLYAVKFVDKETGQENIIITGGAIKLVAQMGDDPVVDYEEIKQDIVIDFITKNGYTTRDCIEKLIISE